MPERDKHVMVYHYDPKKRFYLVSLVMDNKPGTLGNLANVVGIRGMNILEGYFGARPGEAKVPLSFFVESTNQRLDAKWLKEIIESSVGVSDVEVKDSVEGFLADSQNFPLIWNSGDRAVLMRVDYIRFMFDAVRKAIGDSADEVIYQQGLLYGRATWDNILSTFRPRTKEGVGEILQIYNAVGWSRLALDDLDLSNKRARIRATDCFECVNVSTGKPSSHFVRGHLAGAMSSYFKAEMKAVETKCLAAAGKFCEFEISG